MDMNTPATSAASHSCDSLLLFYRQKDTIQNMSSEQRTIVLDALMSVPSSATGLRHAIQLELDHSTSRLRAIIASFRRVYNDNINEWFQINLRIELVSAEHSHTISH